MSQGKKQRVLDWRPTVDKRISIRQNRVRAIFRQAHNAFAKDLIRERDIIVLHEFMTAKVVRKRLTQMERPLTKGYAPDANEATETWKAMQNLSHSAFRARLVTKALANPHQGQPVVFIKEE